MSDTPIFLRCGKVYIVDVDPLQADGVVDGPDGPQLAAELGVILPGDTEDE